MSKLANEDIVIVIPAYNSDEKFIHFLKDLQEEGYKNIIVVDDGSKDSTEDYFDIAEDKYTCKILRHSINLGKGRAYKTAFNYYLSETKMGGI